MKIRNFSKTQLKNAAHIAVMKNFVERFSTLTVEDFAVEPTLTLEKYDSIKEAVKKEESDYKQQQGSDLTALVEEADRRSDRAYNAIATVARQFAQEDIGSTEQTLAARLILKVIDNYKLNTAEQLDTESAMLDSILSRLMECVPALGQLGLTSIYVELRAQNAACKQYMAERDNERAGLTSGLMRADRAATDKAYDEVIEWVNALLLIAPTRKLEQMADQWNAVVSRVREKILHDAPLAADGGVEIDDNDIETPSDTPTPPPANGGDNNVME